MGNRSRTEIVSMILETANGGATKTKIMYNAYLSYNQLKEYISILIVEPRDICHPSPTTTGIDNILSSLSTFTNLA